ncbi:Membrane protein TMS1 [Colletotrichum sidae]|nr:Membrane protein TMS1 [Colletotrichum sidae]
MSAVSMEPDDKQCNPLMNGQGTRTTSIIIGAVVTMLTIAYTTTRAATQSLGLGSPGGVRLVDEDEHDLVTQQPSAHKQMRAEALRRAVEEGSLPADALLSDDDSEAGESRMPGDDERTTTQYNYSVFHIIFFLATTWIATLLTQSWKDYEDGNFAPVGRSYWASWVKIVSAWVCYAIYAWTLAAPVILPDRFDFS